MEVAWVDEFDLPAEVLELNPANDVPVLVDRDLVLYHSAVIMEYLDERFPHPPLMPIDPVTRAQARLMLNRIERDWYSSAALLLAGAGSKKEQEQARKLLQDGLTAIAPMFSREEFAIGDGYTVVDCSLAPILWRLPQLKVKLPKSAMPLVAYAERMFAREGFRLSLGREERDARSEALAGE